VFVVWTYPGDGTEISDHLGLAAPTSERSGTAIVARRVPLKRRLIFGATYGAVLLRALGSLLKTLQRLGTVKWKSAGGMLLAPLPPRTFNQRLTLPPW
jgi:hypothetical protein